MTNYLETMQDIIQKSEDTSEAILQSLEAIAGLLNKMILFPGYIVLPLDPYIIQIYNLMQGKTDEEKEAMVRAAKEVTIRSGIPSSPISSVRRLTLRRLK